MKNTANNNEHIFRPMKKDNKERVLLCLDKTELSEIDELALCCSITRTQFIEQCIEFALDHIERGGMT